MSGTPSQQSDAVFGQPQREDSRAGNESAKALEIAWERVLWSSKEAVWDEGEEVTVEVELEVVELF